jgi:uncharacterized protein involved in exopolysaccharide biosynthesis
MSQNLTEPRSMKAVDRAPPEPSLLRPTAMLLRHWSLLLLVPLLVAGAMIGLMLLQGREYTAESRFSPQAGDASAARLAGLASQFGFAIPGGSQQSQSPEFYAALVRSRELLGELALTRLPIGTAADGTPGLTYVEYTRAPGATAEERLRATIVQLEEQVGVGTDMRSGLVTVRTRAETPELAVLLNERMLDLVNDFNMRKRRTHAVSEREFVESRFAEAQRELEASERALERFHARNRRIDGSPQLLFEQARLQRQVDRHQQVYASLAQAYEQARIDEVRNTPVITVVDGPARSVRRSGSIVRTGVFGFVLGLIIALVVVFAREQFARELRQDPELLGELRRQWRAGPGRLFGRRGVAGPQRPRGPPAALAPTTDNRAPHDSYRAGGSGS